MATLTGRSPKDTYGDLLQVSNANDGVDSTLRFVSDGKGTNSSLKISSASAQFTGTLTSTGLLTTTAGIVSGSDIISDTDSTDDLGSTGVRWANLWVDNITMGGTIAGAVATFSSTMTVTGLTTATGGIFTSGTIIFEGATADAHETTLTVVDPTGDRTVSLPDATDTLVGKATTDTLTNKTLTSPVLNTGLSGTAFLDEDNMASNSATKAASQQSIKAYVDAQVATADTLSEVLAIGNTTGGTDVSVSTDDKVQFRDAAIYINSSTDGQLDIVADTEIQIAATTIDINGAVDVSGTLGAGATTVTTFTSTGIDDNASSTALTLDSSQNASFAGDVTVTDMLNIGDGTTRARLIFTSGDTTPDVSTGDFWLANNSGATSITNFDGGSTGSVIYLVANNANTTLVHSGTTSGIRLLGGANYTMAQYEGKTFVQNGTDWWVEVGGKNDYFTSNLTVAKATAQLSLESTTSGNNSQILLQNTTDGDYAAIKWNATGNTLDMGPSGAASLSISSSTATFAGSVSTTQIKAGNPASISSGQHGFANAGGDFIAEFQNSSASNPFGILIDYTNDNPNDAGHDFIRGTDSGATKFQIFSNGGATFAGAVSKASGSFNIPHPLPEKAETHRLVHSFVESPRADNLYSGMADLVSGTVTVNIDEHSGMTEGTFEALNSLVAHSSSNEGGYEPVKSSVIGNLITIECRDIDSTDTVYWEVRGERHDKHMMETEWTDENGRVIVEPEVPIAATGEVFTPAIEEVTTETRVMETVETGTYVNLAGETIVETEQRGVTTETTKTVVQRQDIDGVSTEVEVEVTIQVPTMETVITTEAVEEIIHSTDVVRPETLEDGQQWRETIVS